MSTIKLSAEQLAKLPADIRAIVEKQQQALDDASKPKTGIYPKVSAKGAVSLYGMGKWPVTLYKEQWERLFANKEQILGFIKANESSLTVKAPKSDAQATQA